MRVTRTQRSTNHDLGAARANKNDEFYTQISDIEKELKHYRKHFKNKTVFCNCDDPRVSNFFTYFLSNFKKLGLKKLVATGYRNDNPDQFSQNRSSNGICFEYSGEQRVNSPDKNKIRPRKLKGDGDFRSEECVNLLKEADIVVTNPMFSLFREYVAQLIEYDKKFLIIGNINTITYKEIFPLVQADKLWMGVSIHSGDREFRVPDHYPLNAANSRIDENGVKFVRVKGVRWWTNIDHGRRHEKLRPMTMEDNLICSKHKGFKGKIAYDRYDNYDAIDVPFTDLIPSDYDGVMGVPITFLDKHNPEQFEIVGITKSWCGIASKIYPPHIAVNAKGTKHGVSTLNASGGAIRSPTRPSGKNYYIVDGEYFTATYVRILIRHKGQE